MPYEKLLKEPGLFCFDKDEFQGRCESSQQPPEGIKDQRAKFLATVADGIERTNGHKSQLGSFKLGNRKKKSALTMGTKLWNMLLRVVVKSLSLEVFNSSKATADLIQHFSQSYLEQESGKQDQEIPVKFVLFHIATSHSSSMVLTLSSEQSSAFHVFLDLLAITSYYNYSKQQFLLSQSLGLHFSTKYSFCHNVNQYLKQQLDVK